MADERQDTHANINAPCAASQLFQEPFSSGELDGFASSSSKQRLLKRSSPVGEAGIELV